MPAGLWGAEMTQIDWNRATKYFLLGDIWAGFRLGMKYFFAPKGR